MPVISTGTSNYIQTEVSEIQNKLSETDSIITKIQNTISEADDRIIGLQNEIYDLKQILDYTTLIELFIINCYEVLKKTPWYKKIFNFQRNKIFERIKAKYKLEYGDIFISAMDFIKVGLLTLN